MRPLTDPHNIQLPPFLDTRLPRHGAHDPEKLYEAFLKNIPKKNEILSLKEFEAEPGYIKELMDDLKEKIDNLKRSFISVRATFEIIEKAGLIKKAENLKKLVEMKDFGLDQVRDGIIKAMEMQAEMLLSMEKYGGTRYIQHDDCRGVARSFSILLTVY